MKTILLAAILTLPLMAPAQKASDAIKMDAKQSVLDNTAAAPNLSTLTAAFRSADLTQTLQGKGPFTVFAPTNDAFGKLPYGTVDKLLKPEDKDTLAKVLSYHIVQGKLSAKQITKMIKKGGGRATLKTVQGETLTANLSGASIVLTDAKGGMSTVTTPDLFQSNGVVHLIDTVLLP